MVFGPRWEEDRGTKMERELDAETGTLGGIC